MAKDDIRQFCRIKSAQNRKKLTPPDQFKTNLQITQPAVTLEE